MLQMPPNRRLIGKALAAANACGITRRSIRNELFEQP